MELLSVEEYREFKSTIASALGKTIRTFERYCSIKADERGDIPVQDLDIIAVLLNCKADDLKNFQVTNEDIQKTITKNQISNF